jgi:hypothetical protein
MLTRKGSAIVDASKNIEHDLTITDRELERFQDTFDKAFFRSQVFCSFKELCLEAPKFKQYHNEHCICSCLKGKTPNHAL